MNVARWPTQVARRACQGVLGLKATSLASLAAYRSAPKFWLSLAVLLSLILSLPLVLWAFSFPAGNPRLELSMNRLDLGKGQPNEIMHRVLLLRKIGGIPAPSLKVPFLVNAYTDGYAITCSAF